MKSLRILIVSGLLISILLNPQLTTAQTCTNAPVSPPLTDLGSSTYTLQYWTGTTSNRQWTSVTELGGLYANGSNLPPQNHHQTAVEIAQGTHSLKKILPRDALGQPDNNGRIGVMAIGMSNTSAEFGTFVSRVQDVSGINSQVFLVNTAMSSATVSYWDQPGDIGWSNALSRLGSHTAPQVQVAWLKLAEASPNDYENYVNYMHQGLANVMLSSRVHFPNLQLILASSRTRSTSIFTLPSNGGGGLNSEPFAFQGGFATRRLIVEQAGNPTGRLNLSQAPLTLWGPYLWINGDSPRSDGLTWGAADVQQDCTHPSAIGSNKVADQLLQYFMTSPYTTPWFLQDSSGSQNLTITTTIVSQNPQTVRFIAQNLGTATPYWNFGDGTGSLETSPVKTFYTQGNYPIRLTAVDATGRSTISQINLSVGNTPTPLPGDFNSDGDRDSGDFSLFLPSFGSNNGFFNLIGPNIINIFDFNVLVTSLFH